MSFSTCKNNEIRHITDSHSKSHQLRLLLHNQRLWHDYDKYPSSKIEIYIDEETSPVAIAFFYGTQNVLLLDDLNLFKFKLDKLGIGTQIINFLLEHLSPNERFYAILTPTDESTGFYKNMGFKAFYSDEILTPTEWERIRDVTKNFNLYYKIIN